MQKTVKCDKSISDMRISMEGIKERVNEVHLQKKEIQILNKALADFSLKLVNLGTKPMHIMTSILDDYNSYEMLEDEIAHAKVMTHKFKAKLD